MELSEFNNENIKKFALGNVVKGYGKLNNVVVLK